MAFYTSLKVSYFFLYDLIIMESSEEVSKDDMRKETLE